MDFGLLLAWVLLFFWRKDVRKEMLFVSIPMGVISPFLEWLYIIDWWKPLYLTGTPVGLEDFIFGFTIGGISAVVYEEVFKKKIKERKFSDTKKRLKSFEFWIAAVLSVILFYLAYFLLHWNTFWATSVLLLTAIIYMLIKRPDLTIDSLVSGIMMVVVSAIVYSLVQLITPGWIDSFWHFKIFPRIIIFSLPIEDIIFYLLFGMVLGPLYEFWQEERLVNMKK